MTYLEANRAYWNQQNAQRDDAGGDYYSPAIRANPQWGIFRIPESEVGILTDIAGKDVVELGCGVGYVSAWCVEGGARSVVGIDNSPAQLRTAQRLQNEFDVPFGLVFADAEQPPLRPRSFDLAINEYGAAIWCDPYRWIPAAAHLLRPGGQLIFLGNSILSVLCMQDYEADGPAQARLLRPQRGLHQMAWPDTKAVDFHISHGDMIRLLRQNGFIIDDLIELYTEPGTPTDYDHIDAEWAAQWPAEEVWKATLTA